DATVVAVAVVPWVASVVLAQLFSASKIEPVTSIIDAAAGAATFLVSLAFVLPSAAAQAAAADPLRPPSPARRRALLGTAGLAARDRGRGRAALRALVRRAPRPGGRRAGAHARMHQQLRRRRPHLDGGVDRRAPARPPRAREAQVDRVRRRVHVGRWVHRLIPDRDGHGGT